MLSSLCPHSSLLFTKSKNPIFSPTHSSLLNKVHTFYCVLMICSIMKFHISIKPSFQIIELFNFFATSTTCLFYSLSYSQFSYSDIHDNNSHRKLNILISNRYIPLSRRSRNSAASSKAAMLIF